MIDEDFLNIPWHESKHTIGRFSGIEYAVVPNCTLGQQYGIYSTKYPDQIFVASEAHLPAEEAFEAAESQLTPDTLARKSDLIAFVPEIIAYHESEEARGILEEKKDYGESRCDAVRAEVEFAKRVARDSLAVCKDDMEVFIRTLHEMVEKE